MTPSYEKMLELFGILDSKFAALSATVDKENQDKNQLASRINETKNISNITGAIGTLSSGTSSSMSVEATEQQIKQRWTRLNTLSIVADYISEATQLATLFVVIGANSSKLKKEEVEYRGNQTSSSTRRYL